MLAHFAPHRPESILHPIYLKFEAESIDVPAESLLDLIGSDIFWIDLLEQRV